MNCIACGSHLLEPFYNPGSQPLSALNLPRNKEESKAAVRYPMNFHVCLACGHIFNVDFNVALIPYENDSNLMFNGGAGWDAHIKNVVRRVLDLNEMPNKTVIDIGAGDGMFLDYLQKTDCGSRCIAFEPGIEHKSCTAIGLETHADYFIPARDIPRFKPDVLVCRHVLEHMEHPRDFVADLAYYSREDRPLFLAEVPCIEKALKNGRFGDYLYEHVSNYTLQSFVTMMERAGWFTIDARRDYNDEVIVWTGRPNHHSFPTVPNKFDCKAVKEMLQFLLRDTESYAFWGGTGKGAAFLNACGITEGRVIDSDVRKAGRYVPGMGQRIEAASSLLVEPVGTIIITTRWRAADIYMEIKRDYPCVKEIFIVDNDAIRQYTEDDYVTEKAKEA